MRQTLLCIFSLCLVVLLNAQDETINLSNFNDLSVATNIELELIPSSENKMKIEIIKGKRSDLKIEEKGNNLSVYIKTNKKWSNNNRTKAFIRLYFKELEDLSVAAGAKVFTEGQIKSEDFDVDVSSGASLHLGLETGNFDSTVSSGGSLKIEGSSTELEVNASSGGSFQGSKFKCKTAEVGASSGGSISIWVSESIEAETSSGGSIKYGGNPTSTDIDRNKWSGGSIISVGNE